MALPSCACTPQRLSKLGRRDRRQWSANCTQLTGDRLNDIRRRYHTNGHHGPPGRSLAILPRHVHRARVPLDGEIYAAVCPGSRPLQWALNALLPGKQSEKIPPKNKMGTAGCVYKRGASWSPPTHPAPTPNKIQICDPPSPPLGHRTAGQTGAKRCAALLHRRMRSSWAQHSDHGSHLTDASFEAMRQ